MSIIISSTAFNPAALQADELYIQIISPPTFLQGVPTDVAGIVGTASWGPLNSPQLMGSTNDLVRLFGPITTATVTGGPSSGVDLHDLSTDVTLAFAQAQSQASLQVYGVRVSDGTDAKSTVTLINTATSAGLVLSSFYTGTVGNSTSVTISTGSKTNSFNTAVTNTVLGINELYPNVLAPASGTSFWQNLLTAINSGISGFRGPSSLVTAASGAAFTSNTAPSATTYTMTGGLDGRSGVTTAQMLGSDAVTPRTGIFALRNLAPDIGVFWIAGMTDSTSYATQQTLADSEGAVALLAFPTGTSTASAISIKQTSGIDDPFVGFVKDWIYFFDPVNNQVRLVAPLPVVGGRIATLAPQISPSNKQVFSILGTERISPFVSPTPYSLAEVGQLESAGILFVTNPIPAGNIFGVRHGNNSSSNPVQQVVEYSRMTLFLTHSFAGFMGKFVGQNQTVQKNDITRAQVRQTLNTFLDLLQRNGQIDQYQVQCDLNNNTPTTIAQHFLFANVKVRYLSSIKFFVLSIQGGSTVSIAVNSLNQGLIQ